jgi:peroxiredoxin
MSTSDVPTRPANLTPASGSNYPTTKLKTTAVAQKIELISNVVFIAAAVLLVALLMRSSLTNTRPRISEGETLPTLTGYNWQAHSQTLVLALRVGCHFCQASAPFYRKLREFEKEGRLSAHLIAILPDEPAEAAEMLHAEQLDVDLRAAVPFGNWKITATPTLLLVDPNGRVLHVWEGQLPTNDEQQVVNIIRTQT